MWHSSIADVNDYEEISKFYSLYYAANHPLFHFDFWKWQYTDHPQGRCIVIRNDEGAITGHVGAIMGGNQNFLINILVDKNNSGPGLITSLFDTARQYGPLTVALANAAGTALLQKKGWMQYENLQRLTWIHPDYSSSLISNDFFEENPELKTDEYPSPEGYFWKQPGLVSKRLPGENNAAIQGSGIRLIEVGDLKHLVDWAFEIKVKWMDYVCMPKDPIQAQLVAYNFRDIPSFPWFIDPLDLSREVTLNLFAEQHLPDSFLFSRKYSDMVRRGFIATK